jgi:hypothetical protein
LGRRSPSRSRIIVNCSPELHELFYSLRRQAGATLKKRYTGNSEFLSLLLNLLAERLAEERRRYAVESY